jgi:hypothetical protein
MGDKIKPWHERKPKHGNKEHKRKRIVPLRPGNERVSPLRVDDDRVSPLTTDSYDDWEDERWES